MVNSDKNHTVHNPVFTFLLMRYENASLANKSIKPKIGKPMVKKSDPMPKVLTNPESGPAAYMTGEANDKPTKEAAQAIPNADITMMATVIRMGLKTALTNGIIPVATCPTILTPSARKAFALN